MYIVAYDITDNKRLREVANTCLQYLSRVQKSVFEGDLTPSQLHSLKKELKSIMDDKTDSILFYFLKNSSIKKRIVLGKRKNDPFFIKEGDES